MSSTSWGQAPARWQPETLRTVSPQASRVVRPAEARRRTTSGIFSSWMKLSWMFWRVVMWAQPREKSSAMWPIISSWSGCTDPKGTLILTS